MTGQCTSLCIKHLVHPTVSSDVGSCLTCQTIRGELKTRVMVKNEGKIITTNTLCLTFKQHDMPKEIIVGYLKVKADLFVPNPLRCFNCSRFCHTSQCCKTTAKCQRCGEDKHRGQCDGPLICSNYIGPHTVGPAGTPSHGGDVVVYVFDINQLSLPAPFYSILMSIPASMALSTVFPFHKFS